ncbi:MAG: hypothetical protein K6U78_02280 [Anaerolineae bacterium]|jgi:hypothetical protein|nr:hypothetical protein [Anaerolineae bacterium]
MFDTYSFHLLMRRRIRLAIVALTLMLSVMVGMLTTHNRLDLPSPADSVEVNIAVRVLGHTGGRQSQ